MLEAKCAELDSENEMYLEIIMSTRVCTVGRGVYKQLTPSVKT